MKTARIFIGSSAEALPVAEAVHANLEHEFFCQIWTHGVFSPSQYPLDALLAAASESDYAIFVLHPDDLVKFRGRTDSAPRDNVVLELGIFLGKLGRSRTCFIKPRGVGIKIPSDLAGLVPAGYNASHPNLRAALGPACTEIKTAIRSLLRANSHVRASGFFEDFSDRFSELFLESDELTTFFIHSRRWREMHDRSIRAFLSRGGTRAVFLLPNLSNAPLFDLFKRNFIDGPLIKSFVIDSYRYFSNLQDEYDHQVKVYDYDVYPAYSYYKFTHYCILAMYPTFPRRQSVPTFEFSTGDPIVGFVEEELQLILAKKSPKTGRQLKRIANSLSA